MPERPAETQARDAQIEAALERVRSGALGMRKPEDVRTVIEHLYAEMKGLDPTLFFVGLYVFDPETEVMTAWPQVPGQDRLESYEIPRFDHPFHDRAVEAFSRGSDSYVYELKGEEKKAYDEMLFSRSQWVRLPEEMKRMMREQAFVVSTNAAYRRSLLEAATTVPLSPESTQLLERFVRIVDLAMTRYEDLRAAAAAAREARIEASMERVRARAMSMMEPEELNDVVNLLRDEFGRLGLEDLETASLFLREGESAITTATRGELSEESWDVLRRGAGVFELANSRFQDLLRAREDLRLLMEEKAVTERTLAELRATQAQLVQQEKLASLGSLTAGIAHEIKNPLNFVNNFAEVNAELAEEAREALAGGDLAAARQALADLEENAAQIAKHGKRADSIVKAMMQHARGGASELETIDVNTFTDEYVGLAWHGLRARDDRFRAEVVRDFDPEAGSLRAMPQELGRVVLNLLNNAFHAVQEKAASAGTDYRPTVTVGTRRRPTGVEISVTDNGPGIRPEIREKIFEPFYTTKATGERTGLGLSLSFDIVTKGHGGTLSVEEGPGGGARFLVALPA